MHKLFAADNNVEEIKKLEIRKTKESKTTSRK